MGKSRNSNSSKLKQQQYRKEVSESENFLTETMNHFNISEEVVKDSLIVKAGHQKKVEDQIQRYGKDGPIKVEIYFDSRNGKELMIVNKIMKKTTDTPIRTGQ